MSSKGKALGLNFARIAQQMNVKKEFLSHQRVKITSPGFPYEAFNGNAHITPWSILHMVESSRNAAFKKFSATEACFLDVDQLYKDYLMFIVSTKTEVAAELYDHSSKKGPVEMDIQLEYVGKTSYNLKTSLYLPDTAHPVATNFVQSVFVDARTRQPASPPAEWLVKFGKDLQGGPLKLARHSEADLSAGVPTEYEVNIGASHVDTYWHTNWASYSRFSYEAMVSHVMKTSSNSSANPAAIFRPVKSFSALYLRESNLGDKLRVKTATSPDSDSLFRFQILKSAEVVCETGMELYPS